jgi:hypothetical protein
MKWHEMRWHEKRVSVEGLKDPQKAEHKHASLFRLRDTEIGGLLKKWARLGWMNMTVNDRIYQEMEI